MDNTLPGLSPIQRWAPELLLRAQDVRVAFFDVDGVLTDGGLYFAEYPEDDPRIGGEQIKRFNTLDGHGLKLLQQAGIVPAVITGRDSRPLRARLTALGIEHVHFGTENKRPAAEATLAALGLKWHQVAAMGDDWPDLPVLRRAAFACVPATAHAEVRAVAHYTTTAAAGHGAVRECCDLLLAATGRYDALLQAFAG
ncbi:HAD family hydrolase [Xylophilus rhododendri]|uniref:3-deoxy-D-manno-octulosonate 8-phosphate phosphatase KdsC n=1 Tax=Xylophilus rhododendri TaxID=2697032 RepID=A0A857J549_9BURK|nr:HAD hydrolase family protein [Xylophilus rhododendri]QHI98817.1 HAD family hydrolase [Xylophilus rhododendri]